MGSQQRWRTLLVLTLSSAIWSTCQAATEEEMEAEIKTMTTEVAQLHRSFEEFHEKAKKIMEPYVQDGTIEKSEGLATIQNVIDTLDGVLDETSHADNKAKKLEILKKFHEKKKYWEDFLEIMHEKFDGLKEPQKREL